MPYPPFTRTCHVLGDIGHTAWLTPFCRPCRRQGRYALARLIEEHGAGYPIILWTNSLERACPHWRDGSERRCRVQVDELLRQFMGMGPKSLADEPL